MRVTPVSPAGTPRACASGSHGASSSSAAKHEPTLPDLPVRRAVLLLRLAAADVAHHELQRAADREVGAVALPEARCRPRSCRSRCCVRAGDDHRRPGRVGRGERGRAARTRARTPPRPRRSTTGSASPRATRHDGVDRHLLDGRLAVVGRHDANDVLRDAAGVLEHRDDPLGRRRDHRQAVGQPAVEKRLERVLEPTELDLARADPTLRPRGAGGDRRGDLRIAGEARAAARPQRRAARRDPASRPRACASSASRSRCESLDAAAARRRRRATARPAPRRGRSARRAQAPRRAPARAEAEPRRLVGGLLRARLRQHADRRAAAAAASSTGSS